MTVGNWLAVLACIPVLGTDGAGPAKTPFPSVESAVQGLGHPSFKMREAASLYLWRQGRAAEPALEKALTSANPEISQRASLVLQKFRWGIFADTPPEILKNIEQFRQTSSPNRPAIFKRILEQGPGGLATAARLVVREAEPDAQIGLANQLAEAIQKQMPALLAREEYDRLETILEDAFPAGSETVHRHLAAYLILRGKVDDVIGVYRARAEVAGGEKASRFLTYLYRATGDNANLRWAAEKSGDENLRQAVLAELGAWTELSALEPNLNGPRKELGLQAMIHQLAGKTADYDRITRAMLLRGRQYPAGHNDIYRDAVNLLFNGKTEDGLELLRHGQLPMSVFEVLCAQHRYTEAFQVAEKADGRWKYWVKLHRIKTLCELGERDQALAHLKREAASWKPDPNLSETDNAPFIAAEFFLDLEDDAVAHSLELFRAFPKSDPFFVVAYLFSGEDGVDYWWLALRKQDPQQDLGTALRFMHKLLNGRLPRDEFEKQVRLAQDALHQEKRTPGLSTMAELCQTYQRPDLALECLSKRAAWEDNSYAWEDLGKFHYLRKEWQQAEACYARAHEHAPTWALAPYLRGVALTHLGRKDEARKLMTLADWITLGDMEKRYNFASQLIQFGFEEESNRQNALVHMLGSEDDYHARNSLSGLADAALRKKDYLRAAELYLRGEMGVLQPGTSYWYASAYIGTPYQAGVWRAQGLLAAGKVDQAWQEVQTCLTLLPGSIELPTAVVPELDKRGEKQKADQLFQQVFDHYGKLCRDYPRCAKFHNQRAWLAARCHRQLDQALEHAKTAVTLEPKKAGYLDTLGEVHFQRGDKDAALECIRKCIILDPAREYFRQQENRFQAGDPLAPVPEADGTG